MAIVWFICSYKRTPGDSRHPSRYCAMNDYTPLIITQDGGNWSETEVLGGYALVKVRATAGTLDTIAAATGFQRIPRVVRLGDTLASLSTAQRNAIKSKLNDMGYTNAEILGALGGDLSVITLGQVLRFAASRRLKPRYDSVQDQIVLDGDYQACRPVADVDAAITE